MFEKNQSKVFSRENVDDVKEVLKELIQYGIDFKNAPPLVNHPDQISGEMIREFTKIDNGGQEINKILKDIQAYLIPYCLNFSSPSFIAHNDCGNDIAAVMGDILNAFLQQNLSSFDYSPIASLIEIEILKTMRQLVGYNITHPSGTMAAGGGVVFGGAGANFSCLLAAREELKSKLKSQGKVFNPRKTRTLANRPFSHFSLRRSLYMLGLENRDLTDEELTDLGLDKESLLDVESKNFKMDPYDLESKINSALERGQDIMCIFIISGDSRMMSFDNIKSITKIAEKYDIWTHVDACEGGQVLFSPKLRKLMEGVENTDSITIDPHKTLMIPYNLSLFLLKDAEKLNLVSGGAASVIKQDGNTLGTFTPTINSKSFISLKLLLLLKHWGWNSLASEIERRHEMALRTAQIIRQNPHLKLINPEIQHNAVAFIYWPREEFLKEIPALNQINERIHLHVNRNSEFFIHSFPSLDDSQVVGEDKPMISCLRIMIGNPLTSLEIVENCLKYIADIGITFETT